MVVMGLGREARGYQFKLEPDSKMVYVETNEVQVCVLHAGDGGGGAGARGKRLPVQAGAQQQDGPRSN